MPLAETPGPVRVPGGLEGPKNEGTRRLRTESLDSRGPRDWRSLVHLASEDPSSERREARSAPSDATSFKRKTR